MQDTVRMVRLLAVLVTGATGGTGREVVNQALAAGYTVRALGNDAARFRTFEVIGDPNGSPPDWNTFFDGLEPDER